ncbi:MAG: DUF1501 domain-containing protein [Pseudomonadota bacterium]
MLNRRLFLKSAGSAALTSGALAGSPLSFNAHAAETTGYKALVCVFLLGGLDNHDVLLPFDQTSFSSFSAVRQSLLNRQGSARQRQSLLSIIPDDTSILGGREVALPPEMPRMKALFDQGQAAIVANVGPLIEPVTRQTFESGAARLPPRLFSHNDQQATWQASAPEGAQFGWGGLFADAILNSGANLSAPAFTTIASTEVGPFLTGRLARPYNVDVAGAATVYLLDGLRESDLPAEERQLLERLQAQLRSDGFRGSHILERDFANAISGGFASNDTYDQARRSAPGFNTIFPEGELAAQLRAVADTIAVRDQLSVSRQIFFVGIGGFDTHSDQAGSLPALLGQIDGGVAAFYDAMTELGLSNDVTLFTASDFGRTLAVNGDGTDHGWGGHSFVVGGSVRGKQIYGRVPDFALGHAADSGNGRIIPSVSVEQFAAPLGRWFGLDDSELGVALPNLRNFDANALEFI